MIKIKEKIGPQNGAEHKLFGVKMLKRHQMREPEWTAPDKLKQYSGLVRLYKKNQVRYDKDVRKRLNKLENTLEITSQKVYDNYRGLGNAVVGDVQRTRNAFLHHQTMMRCYQFMLPQNIITHIDHKTFVMRKEMDRLNCLKNKLAKEYEDLLLVTADMQVREIEPKTQQIKDDQKALMLEVEIKNAQTRTRTVRTINTGYQKMLDALLKDSKFYDGVLNALDKDMAEQQSLITQTIRMGIPALENVTKLSTEFEGGNTETQKEMVKRRRTLWEHREKLEQNSRKVLELVRQDSDFSLNEERYDRDTPSMTDLKTDRKEIFMVIQKLANITSVATPEQIFPRIKKLDDINDRLFTNLIKGNSNRIHTETKSNHAKVVREVLKNDLSDAELKRLRDIERINGNIRNEQKKQKQLEKTLLKHQQMVYLIQTAFLHIVDALRHVGREPREAYKVPYPSTELKLPLLEFTMILPKAKPPTQIDQSPEVLIGLVKEKISKLMGKLGRKGKSAEDIRKAQKTYYSSIMKYFHAEQMLKVEAMEDLVGDDHILLAMDPNVPTRLQIKMNSAKLVEERMTTEDD